MRLSGGRLAGIIFMLFGIAVAFFMTFTGFKSSLLKKMIGKGLEEYDAVVSRVFEVECDEVYEEDTDGYSRWVTVYDCEVELQYEIDGITYFSKYTFDDMSKPVTEGKKYIIYANPENPEAVRGYKTVGADNVIFIIKIVFAVIGGILFLVGLIAFIKSFKKNSYDEYYDGEYYDSDYDADYDTNYDTNYNSYYDTSYEGQTYEEEREEGEWKL